MRFTPASRTLRKSKAKSNNKQIIPTIIFLTLIENEEFTVHLNLVDVFPHPQVNFATLFANWDAGSPIVSVVMPLLFSVSHNVSIDCRHTETWWRSENGKPGWATKRNLSATCYRNRDKQR